jgi:hypothetical protein
MTVSNSSVTASRNVVLDGTAQLQTASGDLTLAPGGMVALSMSATAVSVAAGHALSLPSGAEILSSGSNVSFNVMSGGTMSSPLNIGASTIVADADVLLAAGKKVKSPGAIATKASDLQLSGGDGSGANAGGGNIIIRAGRHLLDSNGISQTVSTTTCSAATLFGAGTTLHSLTAAQHATLTNRCSPGYVEVGSDDTKMLVQEKVVVDQGRTDGNISFIIDNQRVLDITKIRVETFKPLTVNGFALTVSDERVKVDIRDAPPTSLENFRKLRLREYQHHPTFSASASHEHSGRAKGFIAQEVAKVLPHAVQKYNKTYSAHDHEDLHVPEMNHLQYDYIYLEMFGAMKEILADVDKLKLDVAALKAQLLVQR